MTDSYLPASTNAGRSIAHDSRHRNSRETVARTVIAFVSATLISVAALALPGDARFDCRTVGGYGQG